MVEAVPLRLLFIASEKAGIPELITRMKAPLGVHHDLVLSMDQYEALADKYSYDACVVMWAPHVATILNDQTKNSQRVKWVQSLSAGVDSYMTATDFKEAAHIPLCNVKGPISAPPSSS